MKFVCEKCDTKYSIADEKVRRKVLKIRCKNCGNIITVRESDEAQAIRPFKTEQPSSRDEFPEEATRLSGMPDFGEADQPLEDEWYFSIDGAQFGPMTFTELCSRVRRGEAGRDAYVWRDGFDDWQEIEAVGELRALLPKHPPPPPKGKSGVFNRATLMDESSAGVAPPAPPPLMQPSASFSPGISTSSGLHREISQVALIRDPSQVVALPVSQAGPLPLSDSDGAGLGAVAPPPAAKTPMWMVIAGISGGLAALCGLFLVAYFLFFQGEREGKAKQNASRVPLVAAAPQMPPDMGVDDEEPLTFPPMEIAQSEKGERAVSNRRAGRHVVHRRAPARAVSKASHPEPQKQLSADQRRLMALYGDKSTPEKQAPEKAVARRKSAPRRRLQFSDLRALQLKHRASLTACYQRALKRDDSLAEVKAEVEVSIGDSGVVRTVQISGFDSPGLVSCLSRTIRRWAFPAVGAQTISFPIIFRGT